MCCATSTTSCVPVAGCLSASQIPDIPGLEVTTSYLTSDESGGDYYDFPPLPVLDQETRRGRRALGVREKHLCGAAHGNSPFQHERSKRDTLVAQLSARGSHCHIMSVCFGRR